MIQARFLFLLCIAAVTPSETKTPSLKLPSLPKLSTPTFKLPSFSSPPKASSPKPPAHSPPKPATHAPVKVPVKAPVKPASKEPPKNQPGLKHHFGIRSPPLHGALPGSKDKDDEKSPAKGPHKPASKVEVKHPAKGEAKHPGKGGAEPPGKGGAEPPGKGGAEPPGKGGATHPGKGGVEPPGKGEDETPAKARRFPFFHRRKGEDEGSGSGSSRPPIGTYIPCFPGMLAVKGFDPKRFEGLWYERGRYSPSGQYDETCQATRYKDNGDKTMSLTNHYVDSGLTQQRMEGKATLSGDGKTGKMTIAINGMAAKQYTIFHLDHKSGHHAGYSCINGQVWVWVFSRKKGEEDNTINSIVQLLSSQILRLDLSYYSLTPQKDCAQIT